MSTLTETLRAMPYIVSWYGDLVDNGRFATFEEACARVSEGTAKGVDVRGYQIVNVNRSDEGSDGLSDEETERFEGATS